MTAKDQLKLLAAGFTIIRADPYNLKVKAKTKERPEWHNLYGASSCTFTTKTGLRGYMDGLLNNSLTVED